MLKISGLNPLGSGVDRVVYPYPERADLCVKIPKYPTGSSFPVSSLRDRLFLFSRLGNKQGFDYNLVDAEYARQLERRGGRAIFRHIPYCHGPVATDLGPGVAWQKITNQDGSPCLSLKDCYHGSGLLGPDEAARLWPALNDFFDWQLREAVMLREIAYTNTLIREETDGRLHLYHIDAIGCVDLLPIARYSLAFARLRIRSKVSRFRKKMVRWLGPPPSSNEQLS